MKLRRESQIGILFIVSLALFYWGINFLKGTNVFLGVANYFVLYENTSGLQVSHPVYINGVRVGRVKSISLLQEYHDKILVTLEIENQINIPEYSQAKLEDISILGGKKITLLLSSSQNFLENGDTLSPVIDKSISQFIVDKALPTLEHFDSTLFFFNKILSGFQDGGTEANRLLKRSNIGVEKGMLFLDTLRKKIVPILIQMDNTINSLESTKREADSMLIYSKTLIKSINAKEVGRLINNLNTTNENIQDLINKIGNNGSLGKLIQEDSLYQNLNNTIHSLNTLLKDLEQNPKRYVHFSLFGRKR